MNFQSIRNDFNQQVKEQTEALEAEQMRVHLAEELERQDRLHSRMRYEQFLKLKLSYHLHQSFNCSLHILGTSYMQDSSFRCHLKYVDVGRAHVPQATSTTHPNYEGPQEGSSIFRSQPYFSPVPLSRWSPSTNPDPDLCRQRFCFNFVLSKNNNIIPYLPGPRCSKVG